jgi:hypothetical protein
MTLDCLKFEWSPAGTAASKRAEDMTRPMAYGMARMLLALVDCTRPNSARAAVAPTLAPTVANLAGRTGLTEHDARAAVHDLQSTGVVLRQRERRRRHPADARWALGYELAPRGVVRGPGRAW